MSDIDNYDESDDLEQVPLFHRVLHSPLAIVHIVFDFVLQYLVLRPWMFLPSAVPALLAGLIALAVGSWIFLQPDATVVARIERQLRDAIEAEDLAARRICLKALMQRDPDSSSYRFQYALLLREEGREQAGQMLLEELASDSDKGYRQAHRLLAGEAMARYGEATDKAEKQTLRRKAIRHLEALGRNRDAPLDYRLGMLYAEDGDLSLAEVQLRRAADQGYGAALMMLSRLQLFQGDAEAAGELRQEARESLESYIAEHPEDLEARITWARCLLDGEEWNRLTQVLGRLRDLETDADYRDRLGTLSLAASQSQSLASPAGAERAVRFARWAFPLLSDPTPAAWRQIELAMQGLAVPSEATGKIRDWLDQTVDVQAEDASLWVLRGKLAEVSEDRDAAEQEYKRAAELEPDFLSELGSFYRRQGNTEQLAETNRRIIENFEPKLREDPNAHLARAAMAEAYADQGRWEEARELLSVDADNPRLRLTLATICTREFDAQLAAISQAGSAQAAASADSDPGESTDAAAEPSPNFELLRTALRSAPDYGPALARLEQELYRESSAGRGTVQRLLLEMLAGGEQPAAIHRLLGLRATWLEDWPTAVSHFEQACRQRPDDAFLRNNLAYSLLKAEQSSNQLRRAALIATEALQLAPGHPEILATRGEIRVRLKEYDTATTDLETALKSLPRRAELHLLLAECYDELGPTTLANMHREKAKQADSQSQAN